MFFSLYLKGIQAQTVANFYLAFEAQLTIIPVINKVDVTETYFKRIKRFIHAISSHGFG